MFSFLPKRQYHHLNTIELSASALLSNHTILKKLHPHWAVCPVLKSNAYGHGIRQLAPLFDRLLEPFLVVDSLYEAYELYKHKVQTPILILGYTHPDNYKVKKLPFHFALFDLETARVLSEYQSGCCVHIFVDTGMHREGVTKDELPSFVEQVKSLNLRIVGLASHFADADNTITQKNTQNQIVNYKKALSVLHKAGIDPQWRHIAASGGAFKMNDDMFNMMRAGIASYGISPLDESDRDDKNIILHPVLALKTHIAQIKVVHPGASIGYNGTYTASKEMKIAILPIGYYEGLNRKLSNKGIVQVQGVDCPIIGNISMNITTIDVSPVPHVVVGDEVDVISADSSKANSVRNTAKTASQSPYELLVKLTESIHRKVIS